MGMIYYKQEKFSLAEIHYRKALSINPHSSVILCHVGMVRLLTVYKIPIAITMPFLTAHLHVLMCFARRLSMR